MSRKSWDEYFVGLLEEISGRATCDRGKNAAIITKDNHILTTGYVGAPSGSPHCDEVGHLMRRVVNEDDTISQHCVRTIHAEENAILQAARFGPPIEGATIYIKMSPCYHCALVIIQSGIKRIVAAKKYHADKLSRELLEKAGIELVVLSEEVVRYKNQ
ncbi:MAG: cytidine/deoxycytidylate deaminase family protein [Patescibacteria group bacterium]